MAIDKSAARAKFVQMRELQGPIIMPGWGPDGSDGRIYYKAMNGLEQAAISKAQRDHPDDLLIHAFIRRALDEEGKNIFTSAEIDDLKREYPFVDILNAVVSMNREEGLDQADVDSIKN